MIVLGSDHTPCRVCLSDYIARGIVDDFRFHVGGKIFSKYKNTAYVGRAVRYFFTPTKVANRLGVRSAAELATRERNKKLVGLGISYLTRTSARTANGLTKDLQQSLKTSALQLFGFGSAETGVVGNGGWGSSTQIHLESASNITNDRVRIYGEYVHFDRFLTALSLADRPVPNNPSATLAGF